LKVQSCQLKMRLTRNPKRLNQNHQKKLEQLEARYKEISESLVDDAFEIVIRSLEG
jgi:hypothetical protein